MKNIFALILLISLLPASGYSVGVADLKFEKKNYVAEKTDCEVSKAIEKFTEFKVFMDEKHSIKVCKS